MPKIAWQYSLNNLIDTLVLAILFAHQIWINNQTWTHDLLTIKQIILKFSNNYTKSKDTIIMMLRGFPS